MTRESIREREAVWRALGRLHYGDLFPVLIRPSYTWNPYALLDRIRFLHVPATLLLFSCWAVFNSLWPKDCSPPGSSVHGISQARILEWVPHPPPGIFPTQGSNPHFLLGRWIFYHWATWEDYLVNSKDVSGSNPVSQGSFPLQQGETWLFSSTTHYLCVQLFGSFLNWVLYIYIYMHTYTHTHTHTYVCV